VAALGIFVAYRIYIARPGSADQISDRWKRLHGLLFNKYYVDEAYDSVVVKPTVGVSRDLLWRSVDVKVIDGLVNGAGRVAQGWAGLLKGIQNGLVRSYAAWILFGTVALLYYLAVHRAW